MPRQARVVAVGAPHHITQRGNNRQDVFLVDEDRLTYLELLTEQSRLCGSQPAWLLPLQKPTVVSGPQGRVPSRHRLMTNHIHLVAVPDSEESMARTLRRAHSRYAQWFNRRAWAKENTGQSRTVCPQRQSCGVPAAARERSGNCCEVTVLATIRGKSRMS